MLGDKASVLSQPPGYRLDLGAEPTDVVVAERLVEQARQCDDPARGAAGYRAALGLWRGPALADVAGLDWFGQHADRLERLRMVAVEGLFDARLALGEAAGLVPELEALARRHPFQESVHRQLMLALYRSGRQQEALAAYQRLRNLLDEELGISPSAPLRELQAAILRQAPELDAPPPPPPPAVPAPHPATPLPAQLPLAVPGFAGRVDELARLDAVLAAQREPASSPSPSVVISAVSGMPGVGKTTLAVHWAHRVAGQFPDGQLYVNLRGFDPSAAPLDPNAVLADFLGAFGVTSARIPADLDARAALYRSVLAPRRVLVVLDNARDAEQVRPLLPGSAGCLAIVTSRNQLTTLVAAQGAQPLGLDPLTEQESHDLFAGRIGADRVAGEPEATRAILDRCARLPLAIAVAAASAASAPGLPLEMLAARLREAADTLPTLSGGDAATDLRDVFTWSYRMLSPDAARLLRLLGLHPGPDLAGDAAASLGGIPMARAQGLLAELIRSNLLAERDPGRYTLHDLLHAFAAEQCARDDSDEDRRAAVRRLLDHYLHTAHAAAMTVDPTRTPVVTAPPAPGVTVRATGGHEQALAWFAQHHAVLVAAVGVAARHGFDEHCWQLAWTLTTELDWHGHWQELVATQHLALDALGRLDDRAGQARTHRDLGRALAQLGHHEDAAAHLGRALGAVRGPRRRRWAGAHPPQSRLAVARPAALRGGAGPLRAGGGAVHPGRRPGLAGQSAQRLRMGVSPSWASTSGPWPRASRPCPCSRPKVTVTVRPAPGTASATSTTTAATWPRPSTATGRPWPSTATWATPAARAASSSTSATARTRRATPRRHKAAGDGRWPSWRPSATPTPTRPAPGWRPRARPERPSPWP